LDELLKFEDVTKFFRDKKGRIVTAVDSINLRIQENQVLALVGESGSGKTTLGRMSIGLIQASKGEILFDGKKLRSYKRRELWRKVQYIHQDPYSSLDPYLTVKEILDRPLRYLTEMNDERRRLETISTFLEGIGLEHIDMNTRVSRLSGGERQRVLVARAFILTPKYVAADEPTTMVDFIHRNEILELLQKVRKDLGSTMLFITHDLSIASFLADYVAIMFQGSIVEYGRRTELLKEPLHPYTQTLFSVTPERLASGDIPSSFRQEIPGISSPGNGGCKYARACPFVFDKCQSRHPPLEQVGNDHWVACYLHIAS
jgi:peptide/nickel transport system ATP-binding protein